MSALARFLPLIGIVLFLGVGFVWRAWLQYRRHGTFGVILFHSPRWGQRLRDALFVALLVAGTAETVIGAVSPGALAGWHAVPPPLYNGVVFAAGALLLLGGTVFMVLAQLNLGASWRIGIDESARPGLITDGFYNFCRNPIFLGMFTTLAGLVILMPTWISAAVLLGAVACVRSQVLEEEAYLSNVYGEQYPKYASRVGRFLPGLGRLNRS